MNTHPFDHETVMAYLDGELAANDASRVAAHIHECADCSQLEADLRAVSSQMLAWNVEPASSQLSDNVLGALRTTPKVESLEEAMIRTVEAAYRRRMRRGRWILAAASVVVAALIFVKIFDERLANLATRAHLNPYSNSSKNPKPAAQQIDAFQAMPQSTVTAGRTAVAEDEKLAATPSPRTTLIPKREAQPRADEISRMNSNLATSAPQPSVSGLPMKEKQASDDSATTPLIARTASLKISVKNFQAAREGVDRIVQMFHGYAATMTVNTAVGEPQSLNAELHIPSTQSDAALAALKALGRVEQEQQGGEEVTAQVVDLDARLKNARETETRMQDILKTHTGKVTDVLEVENQIAEVRGNIEQMEAEQKQLRTRITFSTITLDLREEYQASLDTNAPSAGRRIRNAFIDGFRSAADGSLALIEFLLNAGPSLILAAIILFWPVRWAWRRFANRPRNEPALAD